jgi:hypothetical protein
MWLHRREKDELFRNYSITLESNEKVYPPFVCVCVVYFSTCIPHHVNFSFSQHLVSHVHVNIYEYILFFFLGIVLLPRQQFASDYVEKRK